MSMDTNFLRDLRLACASMRGSGTFVAADVLRHLPAGTPIHSVQSGLVALARRGELHSEVHTVPPSCGPNRRIALYSIGAALRPVDGVPLFMAIRRVEAAVRRWHARAA